MIETGPRRCQCICNIFRRNFPLRFLNRTEFCGFVGASARARGCNSSIAVEFYVVFLCFEAFCECVCMGYSMLMVAIDTVTTAFHLNHVFFFVFSFLNLRPALFFLASNTFFVVILLTHVLYILALTVYISDVVCVRPFFPIHEIGG